MKSLGALLFLCAAVHSALADSTVGSSDAPGKLTGRVLERGSITPIVGAHLQSGDVEAVSDEGGHFELLLPAGKRQIDITHDAHLPLRLTETVVAGQGLKLEYSLLKKPRYKNKYESTVRGQARHEGERFTLKDEELHQLPGTLGDPFRVIGMLPGVTTPIPLLPYYVVRGSSPGSTGFFLDGMRVPQLFHFLAMGGVVHPQLVDKLDFYAGSYDVSFGRYAGGIIDASTRPGRSDGQHGEVEVRLYDASTLGEAKLPNGVTMELGGHVGYPGYILHAIDNRIDLQYYDYQFRFDWKGITIEALGSYDNLNINSSALGGAGAGSGAIGQLRLDFHRVQIRDRERVGRTEIESALVAGIDEMAIFGGQGVTKDFIGWRLYTTTHFKRFRLQIGTDGEVSQFQASNFSASDPRSAPDELGDLAGKRFGVVSGTFAQGTIDLWPKRLSITLGARLDIYHAGAVTLLGIDPRILAHANLQPWLSMNAGFGLYQQPPSFPVALPGVDTYALQLGLQRSWQGSVGIEAKMPQTFSLSLTGYYEKFENLNDTVIDLAPSLCTAPPPESLEGLPATITRQVSGQSYGMELLLRRKEGRVTGWIAYTLSRSERNFSCGLKPADFDQPHVLNVVVQVRLPWRLMAGARLFVQSGLPATKLDINGRAADRNNFRLPTTVQLDLRLDREWIFRRWSLSAFLEVVNATYSQAQFGVSYQNTYYQPQPYGFNWILPSVGLKGRF